MLVGQRTRFRTILTDERHPVPSCAALTPRPQARYMSAHVRHRLPRERHRAPLHQDQPSPGLLVIDRWDFAGSGPPRSTAWRRAGREARKPCRAASDCRPGPGPDRAPAGTHDPTGDEAPRTPSRLLDPPALLIAMALDIVSVSSASRRVRLYDPPAAPNRAASWRAAPVGPTRSFHLCSMQVGALGFTLEQMRPKTSSAVIELARRR